MFINLFIDIQENCWITWKKLKEKGANVELSLEYVSYAFADTFKYSQLVLDTTSYCDSIFPVMSFFIECLVERNFQNRNLLLLKMFLGCYWEKSHIRKIERMWFNLC